MVHVMETSAARAVTAAENRHVQKIVLHGLSKMTSVFPRVLVTYELATHHTRTQQSHTTLSDANLAPNTYCCHAHTRTHTHMRKTVTHSNYSIVTHNSVAHGILIGAACSCVAGGFCVATRQIHGLCFRGSAFYRSWDGVGLAGPAPPAPEVAVVGQANLCCSNSFCAGWARHSRLLKSIFCVGVAGMVAHSVNHTVTPRQAASHPTVPHTCTRCHAQHCYTQPSQNFLWRPHPCTFWKKLTCRAIRPSNLRMVLGEVPRHFPWQAKQILLCVFIGTGVYCQGCAKQRCMIVTRIYCYRTVLRT